LTGPIGWSDISRSVDHNSLHKVWSSLWFVRLICDAGVYSAGCWHCSLCAWNYRMYWSCPWTSMSCWTGW